VRSRQIAASIRTISGIGCVWGNLCLLQHPVAADTGEESLRPGARIEGERRHPDRDLAFLATENNRGGAACGTREARGKTSGSMLRSLALRAEPGDEPAEVDLFVAGAREFVGEVMQAAGDRDDAHRA
jgi:hypothetical protein